MKLHHVLCAFSLLIPMHRAVGFAQIAANVRGRVLDASGAAVVQAQVELTQPSTNLHQATTTSGAGDYLFTNLNPGTYRLDVTAPGFKRLSRTGVTVVVGQTVTVDLVLTVGGDRQTVTVNSDAPLLQSETSQIQTNIAGPTVVAMPLNTRNFVQLSTLAPGVELPPGTLLPRINGGRPRTNEYLYDGISALQPEPGQVAFFPILDDIQEFTVETNNVPAEFGRFNGGVVNVATRSGSNAIHGSLFEFFRNESLNARNYFSQAPARKPEYRRNLYGATLGAPIVHNRLFFFGDYQGVKQLIGVTRISTIPTLAERQGIFTGVSKIYDPTTTTVVAGKYVRQEFPNDTINIPLDPAAKALLARFPTPTNSAAANNYTRTANDADHQNQFDLRLDGAIGTPRPRLRPLLLLQRRRAARHPAPRRQRNHHRLRPRNRRRSRPLPRPRPASRRRRVAHLLPASRQRPPPRLHPPLQQHRRHHPRRHGLRCTRHPRHPHQRRVQQRSPALHHRRIPAARPLGQHLLAVSNRGLADIRNRRLHSRTSRLQSRPRLPLVHPQRRLSAQPHRPLRLHHHRHQPARHHQQRQRPRELPPRPGRQLPDRSPGEHHPPPRPDRRVLPAGRLEGLRPSHAEHRRTLDAPLPLHRKNQSGSSLQSPDPATRLSRPERKLPQRARAALRQPRPPRRLHLSPHAVHRRPLRLRHRLHRPVRHHDTLHHAAVPLHSKRRAKDAGQHQRSLQLIQRPLPSRPSLSRPTPASAKASTPQTNRRLRLRPAVEPRPPASHHQQSLRRDRLRRLAHRPRRHPGLKPQPAHRRAARARLVAPHTRGEPLLRSAPRLQLHRRQNRQSGATPQALSALPQHRHLPQQQRRQPTTTPSKPRSSSASPTASPSSSPTRTPSSSTTPPPSSPPPFSPRQTPAASSPPTPSVPTSNATPPAETCPTSPPSAASTIYPQVAATPSHRPASPTRSSAAGRSTPSSPSNRACPSPSRRPPTTTPSPASRSNAPISSRNPSLASEPANAGPLLQHQRLRHRSTIRHRQRQPQPGSRPRLSRPRHRSHQTHHAPRRNRHGVSRRGLQHHQHPSLRPTERQLRRRSLRQHHRHHHGPPRQYSSPSASASDNEQPSQCV